MSQYLYTPVTLHNPFSHIYMVKYFIYIITTLYFMSGAAVIAVNALNDNLSCFSDMTNKRTGLKLLHRDKIKKVQGEYPSHQISEAYLF